jgi:hypothetical protein
VELQTPELEPPSHIWERQKDEPPLWFRRFSAYRLLGPARSLLAAVNQEKVARGKKESRQAGGSWRSAARLWDWVARAKAWDQYLMDETEARWVAQIMGPSEVKARLSEQARSDIKEFITTKTVPYMTRLGPVKDKDGNLLTYETWDINLETLEKYGYLVKKLSSGPHGPIIELYSSQDALALVGRTHKLFTDVQDANINLIEMTLEEWKKKQTERRAQVDKMETELEVIEQADNE